MNIQYLHKQQMTFIGYSTLIPINEGKVKCPEFWDKEYSCKYASLWQTMKPKTPVEKAILENSIGTFAICVDGERSFEYWIAGLYKGGEVPKGLKLYTFPESDWAIFSEKGAIPETLQELNKYICNEWARNDGKQYIYKAMLEVYSPGDMQSPGYECCIWVPIAKPQKEDDKSADIAATVTLLGIL